MVTPRKFLSVSLIAVMAALLACSVRGQRHRTANPSAERTIGIAPYSHPKAAHFRAIFGFGGNAGLGMLTPTTYIGNASYGVGFSSFSAGFVTSASVTQKLPYRTYSEFDLMYGIALDERLPNYERPSDGFHSSLSAGISVNAYQERWRPYGRHAQPYYLYPPTTRQLSMGLPIQFQAIYEPLEYDRLGFGFGALLFLNISGFAPSYGGAVVIEVKY